jgi:hypothetical protein
MFIKSISSLFLASIFFVSSAHAIIQVTYSPPLAVGSVEHFTISDSGTDVTSNYTIQSIAPDTVSGYTQLRAQQFSEQISQDLSQLRS